MSEPKCHVGQAGFVFVGVIVMWCIGFAQSFGNHESMIHNFSHDARHVFAFPCH